MVLSAVLFYIFCSIFADEAIQSSRWKVFTLAFLFTALLMVGSNAAAPSWIALSLVFVAVAAAAAVLLRLWLKVPWRQAAKIASSFLGANIALSLVLQLILGSIAK